MRFYIAYLILIAFTLPYCAQKEKKEKRLDSLNDPNIPKKPIGWVSDFERIFTLAEANYLDSIIARHEEETTNEIVVVTYTLDSTQIKTTEDFDKFSLSLFKQWGVGKKDKNNGIGIIISTNLRKIRIEVGFGLESKLTDAEAQAIIDSVIIPEFKKVQFFKGIVNGLGVIFKEIK